MFAALCDSPLGELTLLEENEALCGLRFGADCPKLAELSVTPLLLEVQKQLQAYFDKRLFAFDLPLVFHGTPFQERVWNELLKIKYGVTISYQALATRVGNVKACRAVGLANNRNPISIIVPCHRVVGKSGALTGYAGGLHIKQYLLSLEQNHG